MWPSEARLRPQSKFLASRTVQNEGSHFRKKQQGGRPPQKLFGSNNKKGQDVWSGQGLPREERFQLAHMLGIDEASERGAMDSGGSRSLPWVKVKFHFVPKEMIVE